jgi:hypothetical protein
METDEAKEELKPILWFDDVTPEYRVGSNPLEAAIERPVLFGEGSHSSTTCHETVTPLLLKEKVCFPLSA